MSAKKCAQTRGYTQKGALVSEQLKKGSGEWVTQKSTQKKVIVVSADMQYKDVEEKLIKIDAQATLLWKDISFDMLTPTLAKKRMTASEKERSRPP